MRKINGYIILLLLDISGMNALFRFLNRNKAIILWYHGISNNDFDLLKGYDDRHLSRSSLRKQLDYLRHKGYSFVSMTELVNKIENGGKLGKNVVLTFDDGFKNVVDNAYPIMQEFEAKGCFYLVSGLVGADRLLWTDHIETVIRNHNSNEFQFTFKGRRVDYKFSNNKSRETAMKDIKAKLRTLPNNERLEHLKQFDATILDEYPKEFVITNWEQVRELSPDFMEIGSHTSNHPNCANITSDEELEDEIHGSKNDIEVHIGRKVEHFCYPAGSYNKKAIAKVIQSGYKSAVTIENGFVDNNSEFYRIKRINASENFLLFKSRISGSNRIFRRIKTLS